MSAVELFVVFGSNVVPFTVAVLQPPVPNSGKERIAAVRIHTIRSRGSMNVCATSTSTFTTMKMTPAHTVKPITAL